MSTINPETIRAHNPDGKLAQALAEWREAEAGLESLRQAMRARIRERRAFDRQLNGMTGAEDEYVELSAQRAAVADAIRQLQARIQRQEAVVGRRVEQIENVLRRIAQRRAALRNAQAEIARQSRLMAELAQKQEAARSSRDYAMNRVEALQAELDALA